MGQSKLFIFSSKSLEKPVVTRIFSHLVANSSFCTSECVVVMDHFETIVKLNVKNITEIMRRVTM